MAEPKDRASEMEHDTEIRRETEVSDALGPIEGTFAERDAAESALSPDERAGRVPQPDDERPETGHLAPPEAGDMGEGAHVERGTHSDSSVDMTIDTDEVRTTDRRE